MSKNSKPLSRQQLETMHTKQLLNRRNYMYKLWKNGKYNPVRRDRWLNDFYIYDGDEQTALNEQAMIKEILATREHIPNKKESKAMRQAKAKKGH